MNSTPAPGSLRQKITSSPTLVRVVPFILFVILTSLQGNFGEPGRYWIYFLKTLVGAWMLWEMRPFVAEMKWNFSIEAVAVGIGVFIFWVGIDPMYPRLNHLLWILEEKFNQLTGRPPGAPFTPDKPWNPFVEFSSGLAWFFVIARILGSSIVVPPMEEIFYRSFLYRWIMKPEFHTLAMNILNWKALIITALIFGFAHHEWLAGILCGLCYQWLVLRKNRLGDAIAAHAITNFLLGLWIVWKNAWQFW